MSADKQTRHQKTHKPRSDFQRLSRRFMSGFLRSLFLINKPREGQAGFVLPTTVLLLLVMTLTVGALTFRTVSRTQSAFLAREQKMIDNIAAPAADRAKSKLEYLFGKDTRVRGTNVPPSDVLAILMRNVDSLGTGGLGISRVPNVDPYTLPDETRIDINNDGTVDNAWSFSFDLNGDGTIASSEIIAYSVLMDDTVDPADIDGNPATTATSTRSDDVSRLEDTGEANTRLKANNLITRNGPINTSNAVSDCGGSRIPAAGWQTVNSATLEKNFQITAFVSNGRDPGRANSALELQQVRLAQAGNTWGAWFKYDLEVNPSVDFNWNGATHTDGSMWTVGKFNPHMISSHNSCLYTANASEMTMVEVESDEDTDSVININAANSKDFQGQLVRGLPAYSTYEPSFGTPLIHLFNGLNVPATVTSGLTKSNDSVSDGAGTYGDNEEGIMLDPVALFTRNISRHRKTGDWSRATNWATNSLKARIFNKSQTQPFLDDFYRADNRYGPRPNYQGTNWVTSTEGGGVNATRSSVAYDKKLGDEIISTDPQASSLTNASDGLDGYWERQAITNGVRVVVGQRLELGDNLGWNFSASASPAGVIANADPLYPPTATMPAKNKQKQRVTLKDNLAAVQGMVVYQYESANGQMPLACIANTAHPATLQTLRDSRTFEHYTELPDKVKTDFLTGKGTNGWEFAFPIAFDTESKFGAELASTSSLGIALRNLAYFAGDPNGGAPSFTPVQDSNVHPFAHQAMWGDFSVLRRVFTDELDSSAWNSTLTGTARYDALSPADKSSLHSAACTLGLLAYNIKSAQDEYAAFATDTGNASLNKLGVHLATLMDGNISNGEIGNGTSTNLCSGSAGSPGCPSATYDSNYYNQFTPKQWINALSNKTGLGSASNKAALIRRAESIMQLQQIERDRTLGFIPAGTSGLPGTGVGYTAETGTFSFPGGSNPAGVFRVSCDPTGFASVGASDQAQLGLAVAFCSATQGPKYPSLHYLFPITAHGQRGAAPYPQPASEEYINQDYLSNTSGTSGVNRTISYGVVSALGDIAFLPRASNPTATTNGWKLPTTISTASAATIPVDPESMDIKIITTATPISNTNVALSLLDKVMYNGREEMAVRVLDIDLGKLSRNRTSGTTGDYWISDAKEESSGIFYAVREDAAREDSIIRPVLTTTTGGTTTSTDWTACDTFADNFALPTTATSLQTMGCRMIAIGTAPTDPPLSKRADGSFVGISIKPVDFVADPDRRPHGFRLNAHLKRNDGTDNNGDISNSNSRTWGLTFVTDNAAYTKGKLNLHTSNGTNTLEEFTQTLSDGTVAFGAPFYNDRTTSNLSAFATKTGDRWRVAEILADAVHILSSGFVDGSIDEGFIRNASVTPATSFNNQQRPLESDTTAWGSSTQWLRVDGTTTSSNIPIWVSRDGASRTKIGAAVKDFTDATNDTDFIIPSGRTGGTLLRSVTAAERVNATIISGIVPSRRYQTYGGLNNFPRFLEKWTGQNLFIQGAFLQLNFSSAGTGPFNADAWDPDTLPGSTEYNNYYKPPARLWGYDVALQLVPTGPIAARFVSIGRPRSEHYRELPVEDPYVTNLRCSKLANGSRRFPSETGCPS